MEYDHQGMLDSIDALNSALSSAQAAVSPAVSLFDMLYFQKGADLDGEASNDRSGSSVSLSSDGTIVAIGARSNDGNGNSSGHVRVFAWDDDTSSWEQLGDDIDGEASNDRSGSSVSLSSDGTIVAIGAMDNDGNGNSSGHVRVFAWDDDTSSWEQLGDDIDGEASVDRSGSSVSLSSDGTIVAIGAMDNDVNGDSSGHVRVFAWDDDTSSWEQLGDDIDGEATYDRLGSSVSLSSDGTIVAIGAKDNSGNGDASGTVRVFAWDDDTSSWEQLGDDIDGEASWDRSGISVSLSSDGTIVAIGAMDNDGNGDNSGHVRVFAWDDDTSSWEQLGDDIDGEANNDRLGISVSLSSDGTIVAIGAYYSLGEVGRVILYSWNTDTASWEQRGCEIVGEAAGDRFGSSLSLSSDGTIVAIGGRDNDGNGDNSGHVRVFSGINFYVLD